MDSMGNILYNRLPGFYKKYDANLPVPNQLKGFLDVVGGGMDEFKGIVDGSASIFDLNTVPAKFLPYLSEMLGMKILNYMSESQQRKFIKNLPMLYESKGTKSCFEFLGRQFFGDNATINVVKKVVTFDGNGDPVNPEDIGKIAITLDLAESIPDLTQKKADFIVLANMFRPVNNTLVYLETYYYTDEINMASVAYDELLAEQTIVVSTTEVYTGYVEDSEEFSLLNCQTLNGTLVLNGNPTLDTIIYV